MEQHPSKALPANQLEFEQAAMAELCFWAGAVGDVVRQQYLAATVVERWGSGAGFYTDFEVPSSVVRLPPETPLTFGHAAFEMLDVGESGYLIDGYGLIACQMHQADGILHCLECYNFGGGWPTERYIWRDVVNSPDGKVGNA